MFINTPLVTYSNVHSSNETKRNTKFLNDTYGTTCLLKTNRANLFQNNKCKQETKKKNSFIND